MADQRASRPTWLMLAALTFTSIGCASVQSRFQDAQKTNTVAAYEQFIADNPESELVVEAEALIEGIEWAMAKRVDNVGAYDTFLAAYPVSARAAEALGRIEDIRWGKAEDADTATAMKVYLEQYPQGRYAAQARSWLELEAAWQAVSASPSVDSLAEFERGFGKNNRHSREAARMLQKAEYDAALQQCLVEIDLAISTTPLKRGASVAYAIDDVFKDPANATLRLENVNEGGKTPPKANHVYIIGDVTIKAKVKIELTYGKDLYLQTADGTRYNPAKKMAFLAQREDGGISSYDMWMEAGGTISCSPGNRPVSIDIFFEVPKDKARDAKIVFFEKTYGLRYP